MVTTINRINQQSITRQEALSSGLAAVVGNTPLLPLHRLASDLWSEVQVYAKAEWFNPGGSVKDRPALCILRTALEEGQLAPGKR
ncbi:MAG: pyridoxal-phosphate dependent enzyme, partial [Anaerolineales bacterium]